MPGRAATTRAVLGMSGVDYNDVRIPFDQFMAERAKLPLLAAVPVLGIPATASAPAMQMTQSDAMARYVAELTGFPMGDGPLGRFRVDEILGILEDWYWKVEPTLFAPEPEKEALRKELAAGFMQRWLGVLETRLSANAIECPGSSWFVGTRMTIADLKAFFTLQWCGTLEHLDFAKELARRPHLSTFMANMHNDPRVQKHLAATYPPRPTPAVTTASFAGAKLPT